jgi:hypothetical protein
MSKPEKEEERHAYFDAEKFRRILARTSKPMGRWGRIFRRFTRALDSMQGFFIIMLFSTLGLGVFGAVVVGAMLGPFGFLAVIGGLIGGAGLFVEKKVGRSLQFKDYNMWKRTVGVTLAFILTVGLVFFLLFASRTIIRVFG